MENEFSTAYQKKSILSGIFVLLIICLTNMYNYLFFHMTMPNITGDQLAKELMAIRSDIPIIICTGFSERINKKQAEANKVKGFLMKPVVKSEMAQMVRRVLDEAKVKKGS